jgi:hypothetical protein
MHSGSLGLFIELEDLANGRFSVKWAPTESHEHHDAAAQRQAWLALLRLPQCALLSLALPVLPGGFSSIASSSCAALALATWVANCDGTGSILFSRM